VGEGAAQFVEAASADDAGVAFLPKRHPPFKRSGNPHYANSPKFSESEYLDDGLAAGGC